MIRTDIAILGGGLAGLTAAYLLHRAGVDAHLFEARDRLGGRILTTDAAGRPVAANATGHPAQAGFDLGPSWVWPAHQPALAGLLADLGVGTEAQATDGDRLFDRSPSAPPTRHPAPPADPATRRIPGGTGVLVQALSRALPAGRLHLAHPVSALAQGPDGVTLTIPGGTALAGHVLAALPPRLLADRIAFTPALPATTRALWRATPTWMAPHAKFIAIHDQPFWRAAGLSGMAQSLVGPMAEIHDASTQDGQAALFGFLGIGAADRARLGDAAIRAACIGQMVRLFGPQAATPRATLYKDWAADPWTATADDPRDAGHPVAPPDPDGPWADALTLAGSESSRSDAGYLSGAVLAAMRAVARVTAARAATGA